MCVAQRRVKLNSVRGGVQMQRCRAERRRRQVDSERHLIEPHTALVNAFGFGRYHPHLDCVYSRSAAPFSHFGNYNRSTVSRASSALQRCVAAPQYSGTRCASAAFLTAHYC